MPFDGFVRRSESLDPCETAYRTAGPILVVTSVLLTFVAALHGQFSRFFYILSAIFVMCASLSSFISFTLPFCVASKKLFRSGAALGGWPGCSEIGNAKNVVVTDADIFPAGTMAIESIRIVEGASTDGIISCTGSVLAASGCALASAFTDLMRRNGFSMMHVENFEAHEGGGFSAVVNGAQVYVGSSGFMQLMGVRLPRSQMPKTTLLTAVNGHLAGFFAIDYRPTASVQTALVTLLRGKKAPLFAIRDVNVNPLLIKEKFLIPAEGLEFPPFAKRRALSSAEPDPDTVPAAILSREGLGPLADVTEMGSRLYRVARICTVLSLIGSVLGMLFMFLLCWAGSFDAASANNALSFLLLWVIPVLAMTFSINR